MNDTTNLELDVDEANAEEARGDRPAPARVSVGSVWSYTRHAGAPVISRSCESYPDFEREVDRLKGELDETLGRARAHFGEGPASDAGAPRPDTDSEEDPSLAELARPGFDQSSKVEQLMTRDVRTVSPNDRLKLVDEVMTAGGFRHVVVVSEDREVVGVVSQRDIVFAAISWALGVGRAAHEKALESVSVKNVMSSQIVSVDSEEKLTHAAELLYDRKIGCLPVMEGQKLVGILTEADFLAQFVRH